MNLLRLMIGIVKAYRYIRRVPSRRNVSLHIEFRHGRYKDILVSWRDPTGMTPIYKQFK